MRNPPAPLRGRLGVGKPPFRRDSPLLQAAFEFRRAAIPAARLAATPADWGKAERLGPGSLSEGEPANGGRAPPRMPTAPVCRRGGKGGRPKEAWRLWALPGRGRLRDTLRTEGDGVGRPGNGEGFWSWPSANAFGGALRSSPAAGLLPEEHEAVPGDAGSFCVAVRCCGRSRPRASSPVSSSRRAPFPMTVRANSRTGAPATYGRTLRLFTGVSFRPRRQPALQAKKSFGGVGGFPGTRVPRGAFPQGGERAFASKPVYGPVRTFRRRARGGVEPRLGPAPSGIGPWQPPSGRGSGTGRTELETPRSSPRRRSPPCGSPGSPRSGQATPALPSAESRAGSA
jgi:hypothetical protein